MHPVQPEKKTIANCNRPINFLNLCKLSASKWGQIFRMEDLAVITYNIDELAKFDPAAKLAMH